MVSLPVFEPTVKIPPPPPELPLALLPETNDLVNVIEAVPNAPMPPPLPAVVFIVILHEVNSSKLAVPEAGPAIAPPTEPPEVFELKFEPVAKIEKTPSPLMAPPRPPAVLFVKT